MTAYGAHLELNQHAGHDVRAFGHVDAKTDETEISFRLAPLPGAHVALRQRLDSGERRRWSMLMRNVIAYLTPCLPTPCLVAIPVIGSCVLPSAPHTSCPHPGPSAVGRSVNRAGVMHLALKPQTSSASEGHPLAGTRVL